MNDNDTEISVGAVADVADVAPLLGHQPIVEQPPVAPKDEAPKGKRKGKRGKQEVSEAQERAANVPPEQLGLGLFLPDVAQAGEEAQAVFAMVPLAEIEPDPENARLETDPEEDARLMASIAKGGLEDEIKLIPKPPEEVTPEKPAKYRIKDGSRRYAAYVKLHELSKGAGFGSIPSLIRRDQSSGAARVGATVLNFNRSQLKPYEQARGLKKTLDENPGMTLATLAEHANMTEGVVAARLRFFDVPEPLARILGDGEHDLGCLDVVRQFLPASLRDENTEIYDKVYGLVEDLVKEPVEHAGGRVAHLSAASLEREIVSRLQGELGAIDTSSWEYREFRDEPEWKEAIASSPTLTYKDHRGQPVVLVLDAPRVEAAQAAIEQRLQEEEKKLVEEEAKLPQETRKVNEAERKKRADAQFDNEAARLALELRRSALKKALAPVSGLEPKVEKTLLALVARHVRFQDDAADAIADICGLEVSEVIRAKTDMAGFLEKLRKRGREVFWRFVAAATAHYLADPDSPYGTDVRDAATYELWTGSTPKEARQAAEKQLKDIKKQRQAGTYKPPKPEEDARIVDCSTCHLKGGKKGKWCVGDSGHRRRTFHDARLKAWAAMTGKAPTQGHVRVAPRSGTHAKTAKARGAVVPKAKTGPKKP